MIMDFKRILVAVDQSPQSSVVFEQALNLAKKESANLMIFNGIELPAKRTYLLEIDEKTAEAQKLVENYQQKANDL
jgi:nucleotide-binding universal stress UspA family protein